MRLMSYFNRIALTVDWYYGMYILQAIARASINLNPHIKSLITDEKNFWMKNLKIIKTQLLAPGKLDEMR